MTKVTALPLFIDILLWYGASVICTYGTKTLLNSGVISSSALLTVLQLFISAAIGWFLLAFELVGEERPKAENLSDSGLRLYWALAFTFVVGFGALNGSMSYLPVSLSMTLRATEPLFSAALAYFMSSEITSMKLCLTLFIIVTGACLSSFGSSEFTLWGLVLVCAANIAFPLRMLVFKKLRDETKEGSFNIFFGVCWRAGVITLCGSFMFDILSASLDHQRHYELSSFAFTSFMKLMEPQSALLILLNGATYFIYLQWSFIVQTKVSIVTHAVCNSMRRPATILFAVMLLETNISAMNAVGIVLASLGALLYAKVKADEGRR